MKRSRPHSAAHVRYAAPAKKTNPIKCSTLTIVTPLARSGDFSVAPAIRCLVRLGMTRNDCGPGLLIWSALCRRSRRLSGARSSRLSMPDRPFAEVASDEQDVLDLWRSVWRTWQQRPAGERRTLLRRLHNTTVVIPRRLEKLFPSVPASPEPSRERPAHLRPSGAPCAR